MEFEFKSGLQVLAKFSGKENLTLILETSITVEEKNKGLSFRSSLRDNYGMIFVFRPKQKVYVWMKDTFISLDIIFIKNRTIIEIIKNAKPHQTSPMYESEAEVTEFIEINSGFTDKHNIKVGDKVTFEKIALFK